MQLGMAEASDLVLVCQNGVHVQADSALLVNASNNPAFKQILAIAMNARQGEEPAVLPVPDDNHEAWLTSIAVLRDQSSTSLTWVSFVEVYNSLQLCCVRARRSGNEVERSFGSQPKSNNPCSYSCTLV